MDFVHCNLCQDVPSSESKSFWFTNCTHIYCKKCVQKLRAPPSSKVMCVHCKKPCEVLEIGPNMPFKVKKLFTPVEKIIHQQTETMKRVCKFQDDQLDSMMSFAKKEKEMLAKAVKAYQQSSAKLKNMTSEKCELEAKVEFHKKRVEEFEHHIKQLQTEISGSRRHPSSAILSHGGGANFMNGTSQSDHSFFNGTDSQLSDMGNSTFEGFLNGSAPATPLCSQLSNGQMTTPKILGLPKKPTGVRSDNPYMAMWNRTSVDRQKRAAGSANRNKSTERLANLSSESPLKWSKMSSGFGN